TSCSWHGRKSTSAGTSSRCSRDSTKLSAAKDYAGAENGAAAAKDLNATVPIVEDDTAVLTAEDNIAALTVEDHTAAPTTKTATAKVVVDLALLARDGRKDRKDSDHAKEVFVMPTKETAGGVRGSAHRIPEPGLTADKAVTVGETAVAVETAVETVDPRSRVLPPPSVFMHPPRSRSQERVQGFIAR
ncbi:hypothetical protein W97_09338, partial [Coniosporium apollinis CBS 100218]